LKTTVDSAPHGTFAQASSMFTASRVVGAVIGLLKGFLIARWLGPASYGIWQFVNIFGQYGAHAGLSTRSGISREVPFLRGKGDLDKMNAVLGTAFVANFYGPIFYGAVVLAASFFVTEAVDAEALAIYSPVIIFLSWAGYGSALAMAVGLYSVRTRLGLLNDLVTGLLAIGFLYIWGIYGLIGGAGVAALIVTVYSACKLRQYLFFKVDWEVLWKLVIVGLPIMANGILLTSMASVDRMLIAATLSRDLLGVYGLAHAGVVVLQTIPTSIGQMLAVKFAELDGQNKSNAYLSVLLERSTLILAVVLGPIVSAVIACFPTLVVYLLPEYVEGILPGRLLIASVFFLGVSLPVTNWCVSTKRFGPVLSLRLVILVAEAFGIYLVIRNSGGLEMVALVALCAFAVFCGIIIILTNYVLENPVKVAVLRTWKSALPFLIVLTTIAIQDFTFFSAGYVPGTEMLISCIVGILVSVVGGIVVAYATARHTGLTRFIVSNRKARICLAKLGLTPSQ
jgi:O-antigen/teichoic acid export membrane protein